jgi:sulfonate dioxygenase
VADYEKETGRIAKDRQIEIWKQEGIEVEAQANGVGKARYND